MGYFFNTSTIHRQINEERIKNIGKEFETVRQNIYKTLERMGCSDNEICFEAKNLGKELANQISSSKQSCLETLEKVIAHQKIYQATLEQFYKPRFHRVLKIKSDVLVEFCKEKLMLAKIQEVEAGNLKLRVKRLVEKTNTEKSQIVKILARLPPEEKPIILKKI